MMRGMTLMEEDWRDRENWCQNVNILSFLIYIIYYIILYIILLDSLHYAKSSFTWVLADDGA